MRLTVGSASTTTLASTTKQRRGTPAVRRLSTRAATSTAASCARSSSTVPSLTTTWVAAVSLLGLGQLSGLRAPRARDLPARAETIAERTSSSAITAIVALVAPLPPLEQQRRLDDSRTRGRLAPRGPGAWEVPRCAASTSGHSRLLEPRAVVVTGEHARPERAAIDRTARVEDPVTEARAPPPPAEPRARR